MLKVGIDAVQKWVTPGALSDPDVVRYAATVSVWGRWFVWLLGLFLLAYRPAFWYPEDVLLLGIPVLLAVFNGLVHHRLALRYYVKSESFRGHIDPGKVAAPDEAVTKLFEDSSLGVINHEMVFVDKSGQEHIAQAESFSNSYHVFTLIPQPIHRSIQSVRAPT